MARVDYYHDPGAPQANSLVVGSSAVVVDDEGRILLQRRSDSGNWALPGGTMDIGETLADSAIREVEEETGDDGWPRFGAVASHPCESAPTGSASGQQPGQGLGAIESQNPQWWMTPVT
jgi:hypothetical protein